MERVNNVAEVIWIGPFKRNFVSNESVGVPFYSSSTMLKLDAKAETFLSQKYTKGLQRLLIPKDSILISCSGTIGNVCIATDDLEGKALTQDAIRVVSTDVLLKANIFCFLQSQAGQYLLTTSKSGGVIEHIYANDIESLSMPLLPSGLRSRLSSLIERCSKKRVEANRKLKFAESEVYQQLYIDQSCFVKDSASNGNVVYFNDIASPSFGIHHRLDATYFDKKCHRIRMLVNEKGKGQTISSLGCKVILHGKTFIPGIHKVQANFGVPYFTGKELFATRLIPRTFIYSDNHQHLRKLTVDKGTVLVTCAGTIGRVAYVYGPLENVTVTHDAIRVVASDKIYSGYLFAYLNSHLGQIQLKQSSYGSVIPRLHSDHIEAIKVAVPNDAGESISNIVDEAFELRREAHEAENQAIQLFEMAIQRGRELTEAEWGSEY
ncbi:restriction endonuclease subunit S [Gimesia maris]|uniref:restriction endonuclease subunit S n=1 Tax=Gimesia maris TaxID=122 RepID=UPI0032EACF4D